MMPPRCPPLERISRAATEHDDDIVTHAQVCSRCRALLDEQLDTRALVSLAATPALTYAHRSALGAEILARAELLSPPPSRTWVLPIAALAITAAAAIAVIVWPTRDARVAGDATAPVAVTPAAPAPVTPPPAPARAEDTRPTVSAALLSGTADYAHEPDGERDVVRLRRGTLDIDGIAARPLQVVTGATQIRVHDARVQVIATRGVIATVRVFAGAVEITEHGKRIIVEAGATWEPPPADRDASPTRTVSPPPDPVNDDAADSDDVVVEDEPATAPPSALESFRQGWAAMREGRHAAAIIAFDHATDPAVAEDALYWSAVACERARDPEGAIRRYRKLLATFPESPRVVEARAALARLVR
jgi:hypothetical protein